jgi:IclR family transcriptional regulator, KDG regulon repressor
LNESTRAVDRALNILLCFSVQTPELSMTQIAEQVGLHKSTVHRLLATLERKRFVERDPVTGTYRPGIRLLQMAYLTLENNDLQRIAQPYMQELCELHGETVDLSVLDDTDVLYVEVVESHQRVRLAAAKGERLPAFCTASVPGGEGEKHPGPRAASL